MMPVEINRWRATIGCFRISLQKSSLLRKTIQPFSILFQVIKLYWFCCCFIAISILVLPLTLMQQFCVMHFAVTTRSGFLPRFARVHLFVKMVIYTSVELSKRTPLFVINQVHYNNFALRKFLFLYVYFYIACITCVTLHTQWQHSRQIFSFVRSSQGALTHIAFFAGIDQSDAVISLLPRFAARFRPFWVPPNKKTLHARVNRIFLKFQREKDANT